MAGKRRRDGKAIADVRLGLRLQQNEVAMLETLVGAENAQLDAEGRPQTCRPTTLVRQLIKAAYALRERRLIADTEARMMGDEVVEVEFDGVYILPRALVVAIEGGAAVEGKTALGGQGYIVAGAHRRLCADSP